MSTGTISMPTTAGPETTPAATPQQPAPEAVSETPAVAAAVQTGSTVPAGEAAAETTQGSSTVGPVIAASPEKSAPLQLPAEIEVTRELFKISKSKGPDKNAAVVKEAYEAYQSGDYAAAKTKYEKIIKDFPDSRDGLLGMGAIAVYEHDWERAFDMYSRLLTIDPGNTVARAALINLVGASGQVNLESTIKLMLHDNPRSSYLYFSLGNVYASQTRWAEAQQAYFDAYRYDSSNPSYALNLAIALDRLGQSETALDYYNTALKLTSGKQTEFDAAKVQARVDAISANLN